ncbi:hypothetical protein GCM10011594_31720 [Nakamurella endophytica]|uniref:Uncharacterized protein n=2 Tax=Nakamurella endophytica TaxID=1748367 RepID=A0A917T3F4_9ACTN|nr:hypothetical protein GCM10011594_31720 [Nakamurella endophytica]
MDLVWIYLIFRYRRGITWIFAWMFAFWAPALIPIPVIGWAAPPLLYWAAISSRRRHLQQPPRSHKMASPTQRAWTAAMAELKAGRLQQP